ncbi:hypothetical protein PI86_09135 [Burkholderia sp. A9]|uniref:DDE-type integrase/transposase/recombinase n=1 Tax=Burkholderia sp. A9 TaxID=1365108 RepID=UPI00057472A4|nr:DDE-type integrase/transposase/recombinase [Burkholderia sp. A9]KHK59477.1 hypothetical protein PI86_09135 [Burkholderia sp. A9]
MAAKVLPVPLPAVRSLVRNESTGRLYRVVLAGAREPVVVLASIFGKQRILEHIPIAAFRTRLDTGYDGDDGRFVMVETDPYDVIRKAAGNTPGQSAQSDLNWTRLQGLVEDPVRFRKILFPGANRRRTIDEFACEQGTSRWTVERLLIDYLQRGMDELAVASELWRCGRTVQPMPACDDSEAGATCKPRHYKERPGRKPSNGGQYLLPSTLLNQLFAQYIDIYLTSREGPWEVDVSDELMKVIRRTNADAKFPGQRKRRRTKQSRETRRRYPHASAKREGKRRHRTLQDMVDHCNYVTRCVREVRDVTGQLIELEFSPCNRISYRQLQHYWHSKVPVEVRKRRAMGERKYALSGRPKHGHALQHCLGPGTQFMIDATIADVYLVSVYDRTVVVGRPTVYLAMDVWSRMIVGIHVTFDPPSFEGVALVLENIVTPKDEFCARYGLRIDPRAWPCRDLPLLGFMADHGSDYLKALAWKAVNRQLHMPISNVSVRNPLMRALIERRFGTIPARFQPATFGVVEKDATTRGAPRYAHDASETITEFTKKLIRAILVDSQMPIGREGAENAMIFQGEADTPINRWHWGMQNLTGSLKHYSLDEVRRATWPHAMATPTDKGLKWGDAYYTSPFIESTLVHCWGKNGKKKVPIQFNPDDMSQILLNGSDGFEYGYQSGTNRQLPGNVSLMEWNVRKARNSANARAQKDALQPERVMEMINDAEESHCAKREQKQELDRVGLKHPETSQTRATREREQSIGGEIRRAQNGIGKKRADFVAWSKAKRPEPSGNASSLSESQISEQVQQNTLDLLGRG